MLVPKFRVSFLACIRLHMKSSYSNLSTIALYLILQISTQCQYQLQSKLMDWFLYDKSLRHERVN